ncbi:hypothetical protein [Rhodococcus sp. KRD197]|uniref:hypothetical protein n=1 Tax=Rhodococcus sp. KRD197 TaxID=2729731 RepID=UPI0019D2E2E3|nr:hypothetical protein [Rhodococcus sp. KRD197]
MTQHNQPRAHKRTVLIFDPRAHKGTVKTFFDPRTAVMTSDKTLIDGVFSPPASVGRAPLPTQDLRSPATYTWGTAEQRAWWENISTRTVALASVAVVLSAAVAGAAVIARGVVR